MKKDSNGGEEDQEDSHGGMENTEKRKEGK